MRILSVSKTYLTWLLLALIATGLQSCYFFKPKKVSQASPSGSIQGPAIAKASTGPDEAALASLALVTHEVAPAPVRPNPDAFARQLLLMFRSEGTGIAKQIGRVENYRMLLGGASDDFTTEVQATYDATSLLANLKVVEEVCTGLVDPSRNIHGDWQTILPADTSDVDTNIRFLYTRLMGVPSSAVPAADISDLTGILNQAATSAGNYDHEHYVSVCSAILLNAQMLYF